MARGFKLGLLLGWVLLLPLIGLFVFNFLDQSSFRHLPQPSPARIDVGPRKTSPKIAGSGSHLVVLADDGSLWGVGYNDWGQAGGPITGSMAWSTQFNRFPGGSDWVDVTAGGQATLAIRDDGTLWRWGAIPGGLCVPGGSPVQIGTATNWSAISANGGIFGVRTDGTLWAWGGNLNGELGLGFGSSVTNPVPLTTDKDWAGIAAGGMASAAVKSNGTVWVWGKMLSGEPFDGSIRVIGVRAPFQLGTNASFVRVQCLFNSAVAEDREGRLWRRHFADATNSIWHPLPSLPKGLATWSAGGLVVLALDRSGQGWVLGRNRFGVLADRWVRTSEDWLPVEGVKGGMVGAAGLGCAVLSETGELWLWGPRPDDSEGTAEGISDRLRKWLSRRWPKIRPRSFSRIPAFETVPWKAAEFAHTNLVSEAPGHP